MAIVTILSVSGKGIKNLQVRAVQTGGFGTETAGTDSGGRATFKDTLNRVQIEVHTGSRWKPIGGVFRTLRGKDNIVTYD